MMRLKVGATKLALSCVALVAASLPGSIVLAQAGLPGEGRASETESDGYTLRANAYQSEYLPVEMAEKYDVEKGEGQGVLHIVVLEGIPNGDNTTVAAEVSAEQQNLMGQREDIELQKVEENNYISYFGSFEVDENASFRFSITAEPEKSPGTSLSVELEDSFQPSQQLQ